MLTEGAPSPHEAILSVQSPTRAALRMGDWKLLMNANEQDSEEAGSSEPAKAKGKTKGKAKAKKAAAAGGAWQLYNLATDIGEKNNLAEQEKERVAAMRAKLEEMLKDAAPEGNLGKETGAPQRKKK